MLGPKPFNNSFVKWVRSKSKSGNILIRPSYEGSDKDFAISFTTSKTKTIMNTVEYTLRLEHMLFIIQSSILAKETFKKIDLKLRLIFFTKMFMISSKMIKIRQKSYISMTSGRTTYVLAPRQPFPISVSGRIENDPICKIITHIPGPRIQQLSIDDSSQRQQNKVNDVYFEVSKFYRHNRIFMIKKNV